MNFTFDLKPTLYGEIRHGSLLAVATPSLRCEARRVQGSPTTNHASTQARNTSGWREALSKLTVTVLPKNIKSFALGASELSTTKTP